MGPEDDYVFDLYYLDASKTEALGGTRGAPFHERRGTSVPIARLDMEETVFNAVTRSYVFFIQIYWKVLS